ncbi:MAG: cupredoxin domain-containing protein [Candidatus Binataceae bacterium]
MRIVLNINLEAFNVPSRRFLVPTLALLATFGLAAVAAHADNSAVELRFEGHHFSPANLTVPAGQAATIRVVNASKETIEFESFRLNREKAIEPGEAVSVHLPALSAGTYDFYDDFHQDVPQGSIVVK